jgi:branched-chain amino acid transport system permease protein
MMDSIQHVIDALSVGSLYALVALGIGLLFGVLRLVNFAHGDFITAGAYALIVPSTDVTARLFIGSWPPVLMIPTVCAVVAILALLTEWSIYRPLRAANASTLMIASFSVSYLLQNVMLLVYGARGKSVDLWSGLDRQIAFGSLRLPVLQLITIAVTLSLMAVLTLFLKYTSYGVQMRAAAADFRMAQYLGVRGNKVIALAFGISGVLAAAVSMLFLAHSGALSPTFGVDIGLLGFVAVVIGGIGSLLGAVIGGFLVGFIVTFLQIYLPDNLRSFQEAFAYGAVILILLVRPAGLIRSRALVERV